MSSIYIDNSMLHSYLPKLITNLTIYTYCMFFDI